MSLREYHRKRYFTQTSEPASSPPAHHKALSFVIQKHAASHLHYDFRLEMDHVLKSWAVPKGPSLNPKDKRLAIQVEDHPYDYKNFEGVIPKNNYGAGKVMIWDEGYYEPLDSNLLASLGKGHLSFILHGKKLRGEFSLIKLTKAKKNEWLLIKKSDKYASVKDILKKDKSVVSNLAIEHIGEDILKKTPKIKMSSEIKPMLATLTNKAFNNKDWLFEIKWDGYRMLSYINGKKVTLLSRNLKDYGNTFSLITKELSTAKLKAVFDGEITVIDDAGKSHFQLLQQFQKTGEGNVIYYIFDVLWLNGHDLRQLPLIQRKKILKQILPDFSHIKLSEFIEDSGKDFFNEAIEAHLEGIMGKKKDSLYQDGHRSVDWLKIKIIQQQKAFIAGYTMPRGSRKHFGALILGVFKNHQLQYIGHTGSGFNDDSLRDLKSKFAKIKTEKCPFAIPPKTNAPVTWVKPKLLCEVNFTEWTKDGYLRHPIFVSLRDDKDILE